MSERMSQNHEDKEANRASGCEGCQARSDRIRKALAALAVAASFGAQATEYNIGQVPSVNTVFTLYSHQLPAQWEDAINFSIGNWPNELFVSATVALTGQNQPWYHSAWNHTTITSAALYECGTYPVPCDAGSPNLSPALDQNGNQIQVVCTSSGLHPVDHCTATGPFKLQTMYTLIASGVACSALGCTANPPPAVGGSIWKFQASGTYQTAPPPLPAGQ